MSLDRHGCKLQLDWSVEANNCRAVIPVLIMFEDIVGKIWNYPSTESLNASSFSMLCFGGRISVVKTLKTSMKRTRYVTQVCTLLHIINKKEGKTAEPWCQLFWLPPSTVHISTKDCEKCTKLQRSSLNTFFTYCKCCSGVCEPQILIQDKYCEVLCELMRRILPVHGLCRVQIWQVSVKYSQWCIAALRGEFWPPETERAFSVSSAEIWCVPCCEHTHRILCHFKNLRTLDKNFVFEPD